MRTVLISVFIILTSLNLRPQGSSDAGASSFGTLKHSEPERLNFMLDDYIILGLSGSKGDYDVNYYNAEMGYSKVINPRIRVTGKFNMTIIRGELINLSSISDLFLGIDYNVKTSGTISFGLKIPFNSANQKGDDPNGYSLSLPMNYQTSLGTTDIIAGASITESNFFFSASIQYPIVQNSNGYTGWYLMPPTNNFRRKADIIARLSYTVPLIQGKLDFIPGLLPIYHLSNDTFTDTTRGDKEISGSAGLTLNFTSYFVLNLRNSSMLEMGIGFPLKTRTARPEGLARKYIITFQFKTYF